MGFSVTELLLIAFIIMLLFGSKRIGAMGADLGAAIRGFKSALSADSADVPAAVTHRPVASAAQQDEQ